MLFERLSAAKKGWPLQLFVVRSALWTARAFLAPEGPKTFFNLGDFQRIEVDLNCEIGGVLLKADTFEA
jgi:hypothetical protein